MANYHNKTLPELAKLLRERKLGNPTLRNELNKLVGVAYLPQAQEAARQDAIRILTEYDKNRFSIKKFLKISAKALAAIAALIAVITFILQLS